MSEATMQQLLQEITNFVALYDELEARLAEREAILEEKLIANETLMAEQVAQLRESLIELEGLLNETGIAHWQATAQAALHEGKTHIQTLRDVSNDITESISRGCGRLDQAVEQTLTGIAQAANTLPANEFKQIIEQGSAQIKTTSITAVKKISHLITALHWKTIGIALALSLLAIFVAEFYQNNEWPWETHSLAIKERAAGKLLLNAWPVLTPTERQDIINVGNQKK
jgi:hypothetical protein